MGKWSFPFIGLALAMSAAPFGKASILNQDTTAHQEAKIRVRLSERIEVARFRGFDLEINFQRHDQQSEWRVTCGGKSIYLQKISTQAESGGKVMIVPERLDIRAMAGFLRFENRPYRDHITVYPHPVSGCEVINTTALEKYLEGLVNAEFSSKWNSKAVAAQVIAARTYALYKIQEARGKPNLHFDLDSTERDQVYNGAIREDYRAAQVVSQTRGKILMAKIKKNLWTPLKAFYHSTCGGQTTLPERVWGVVSSGFKRKVKCGFCRASPVFQWSAEVKHAEFESSLKQALLKKEPKRAQKIKNWTLLDIIPEREGRDQRADSVITVWGESPKTSHHLRARMALTGNEIRHALGTRKLRSTYFNFSSQGFGASKVWKISGRGNGHGVGMCQWGAKVMAEKGVDTDKILSHYYPDAQIRKLW